MRKGHHKYGLQKGKVCPQCRGYKPDSFFALKDDGVTRKRRCIKCSTRTLERLRPWRKFKKSRCEVCQFVPINSIQLDVDHIDGNRKNNDPTNLRTLCANCHRLKTLAAGEYHNQRGVTC